MSSLAELRSLVDQLTRQTDALVCHRDGLNRRVEELEAERSMNRVLLTAAKDSLTILHDEVALLKFQRSGLTDAWRECFGLVVCRNGSKADQETVNRFWVLMNRAAGTGR